jgi:hypothetical protein
MPDHHFNWREVIRKEFPIEVSCSRVSAAIKTRQNSGYWVPPTINCAVERDESTIGFQR